MSARRREGTPHRGTAMLSSDDVWLGAIVAGAAGLAICICCAAIELRQCGRDWAEDAERRRRTKLNGISHDHTSIELIGARPVSERPPGVDWTISLWAEERGEYCPTDRGYEGRRSRQV